MSEGQKTGSARCPVFDLSQIAQYTIRAKLMSVPGVANAAIVCAITGLARSLSIVTTAEGVETEEQLALVRAAGCNQVQGYLFGRPGPAHALPWAPAVPRRA